MCKSDVNNLSKITKEEHRSWKRCEETDLASEAIICTKKTNKHTKFTVMYDCLFDKYNTLLFLIILFL